MIEYFYKEDGQLKKLTGLVKVGDLTVNARVIDTEQAAQISAYPKTSDTLSCTEDEEVVYGEWEVEDGKWHRAGTVQTKTYTLEDYDSAMEEHLMQERIERGYNTREPNLYINSSNARWKQDAEDWAAHLDDVMEFGLSVMNDYKEGKSIPSYKDFKALIPKIEWTIAL